jgi:signal transduction histidine kinase
VREEERTWIAREIHDHLGQDLTGLKMDLAWLERRLPEDQTVLREKTQAMARLIDTTTQSVRQLSTALRPGLLDDLGLLAALDWLARDFQSRTGIHCECVSALEEDPVGREPATHLFRIVQEALTNIARHANATAVTIRLAEDAGWVVLVVQDDGKGITEQEMTSARGLGLVGIRERALLLGGEVIFTGVPGRGTTVTVKVPRHRGEAGGS